jgi:hypothetical protein
MYYGSSRRRETEKSRLFEEITAQNIPGLYDHKYPQSSINSKWNELKGNHKETYYNQTVKRQREKLEISAREVIYHIQGSLISRFLIRNFEDQKAVGWIYSKCYKGKTVNQNSCILQNCPSVVREKLKHFKINKS